MHCAEETDLHAELGDRGSAVCRQMQREEAAVGARCCDLKSGGNSPSREAGGVVSGK